MNAIAVQANRTITASGFDPALFTNFVSWLDRSARTTKTYLTNLRQFAAWLRFAGIDAPTRESVIAFRDWLQSEHEAIVFDPICGFRYRLDAFGRQQRIVCKVTTIANYLRSVVQFFEWTSAAGLYPNIASNIHAPKVRRDLHRKDALNASDVLTIESSIKAQALARLGVERERRKDNEGRIQRCSEQAARLRAMYLLAVTAGLRCVELNRAKVRDLQIVGDRSFLMVWGKGRSEPDQRKAIPNEVVSALREYLKTRKDGAPMNAPLFVSTGNRSGGRPIASTTISKMLKHAMQAAGFDSERLTAHSLRHTAGTAVQEITSDLYATQRFMRHQNPSTTEIYLHCQEEVKDSELAQRLFDYYERTANRE